MKEIDLTAEEKAKRAGLGKDAIDFFAGRRTMGVTEDESLVPEVKAIATFYVVLRNDGKIAITGHEVSGGSLKMETSCTDAGRYVATRLMANKGLTKLTSKADIEDV